MVELKKKKLGECRELIDGLKDAVFVHDLDGGFLSVNREAVDRLGYSEEELLSMGLEDIDVSERGKGVKGRIRGIEEEETLVFESIHVAKSGEKIPVEISSSLITYQA